MTAVAVAAVIAVVVLTGGWWLERRQRRASDAALAETRRHADEVFRVGVITQALIGGEDPAKVLENVTSAAAGLVSAASGWLCLADADGPGLTLTAAIGPAADLVGQRVPLGASMAGWVVTNRAPLLINDIQSDPRAYRSANTQLGLGRGAVVPLYNGDVIVGALGADRMEGDPPFTADDLGRLERLGRQAVLAITSARAHEDTRRARATLAAKNAELEQAVRTKSEFLRNMSHELRTPLNSIIGFSELLSSGAAGALTDGQREFVETVVRNSRHLLQLINDLLDLSKVEAGKMDLHFAPTDILRLIDGVIEDSRGLLQGRLLTLTHEAMADPVEAVADEVRVRQVLINFVSNAVKFTPDGGSITIRAVRTTAPLPVPADRSGDTDRLKTRDAVWISVSDTGPGIGADDMALLFKEFSQVDASMRRRSSGTGLGLVLCRRFIELHGGTIGAESVPGHGSTFWFLLPLGGPVRFADAYARAAPLA